MFAIRKPVTYTIFLINLLLVNVFSICLVTSSNNSISRRPRRMMRMMVQSLFTTSPNATSLSSTQSPYAPSQRLLLPTASAEPLKQR